jgi:hypothetical protein
MRLPPSKGSAHCAADYEFFAFLAARSSLNQLSKHSKTVFNGSQRWPRRVKVVETDRRPGCPLPFRIIATGVDRAFTNGRKCKTHAQQHEPAFHTAASPEIGLTFWAGNLPKRISKRKSVTVALPQHPVCYRASIKAEYEGCSPVVYRGVRLQVAMGSD